MKFTRRFALLICFLLLFAACADPGSFVSPDSQPSSKPSAPTASIKALGQMQSLREDPSKEVIYAKPWPQQYERVLTGSDNTLPHFNIQGSGAKEANDHLTYTIKSLFENISDAAGQPTFVSSAYQLVESDGVLSCLVRITGHYSDRSLPPVSFYVGAYHFDKVKGYLLTSNQVLEQLQVKKEYFPLLDQAIRAAAEENGRGLLEESTLQTDFAEMSMGFWQDLHENSAFYPCLMPEGKEKLKIFPWIYDNQYDAFLPKDGSVNLAASPKTISPFFEKLPGEKRPAAAALLGGAVGIAEENYEKLQKAFNGFLHFTDPPLQPTLYTSEGDEFYAVVARYPYAVIEMARLSEPEENGNQWPDHFAYAQGSAGILCNYSDLWPNCVVVIYEHGEEVARFSPSISLKDGKPVFSEQVADISRLYQWGEGRDATLPKETAPYFTALFPKG